MKHLKRIVTAIFLITCLSVSLMSCGFDNNNDNNYKNANTNNNQNNGQNQDNTQNQTPADSAPASQAPASPEVSTPSGSTNDSTSQMYNLDFTLINETGVELYGIYLSPSGENSWSSNILTTQTLPSDYSIDISFSPSATARYWDLMVVDYYGNGIYWDYIDLASISQITLYFDGNQASADYR